MLNLETHIVQATINKIHALSKDPFLFKKWIASMNNHFFERDEPIEMTCNIEGNHVFVTFKMLANGDKK